MSFSGKRNYGSKKKDPLNKRIPENPRYAHIKHTVDTGASMSKYLQHLEEVKQNYRYRKDEIFRRIKVTTFAQLVLQVEMYGDDDLDEDEEGYAPGGPTAVETPVPFKMDPPESYSPPDTARSTLSGVISGTGEMDLKYQSMPLHDDHHPAPPPPPPYLLLDVREKDDYEQAHIITAKHYPAAMLSRSCNYFSKEILEYKNKPGKIIVLYDENETIAPRVATTFIQREVDNIFMLSGGMKVLHMYFPGCMITGHLPSSCLPTPPNSSRGTSRNLSSSSSKAQQMAIPLVGSVEHQEKFVREDLNKMEDCLDNALLSSSSGSMSSRASSRSGTGSISQRSMASPASRDSTRTSSTTPTPWK